MTDVTTEYQNQRSTFSLIIFWRLKMKGTIEFITLAAFFCAVIALWIVGEAYMGGHHGN